MRIKIYIFIIYIYLLLLNEKYYWWYPSINTNLLCYGKSYPDNIKEINIIMNDYICKKTQDDINFFFLTDRNLTNPFQNIIKPNKMKKEEMDRIVLDPKIINIIFAYKYIYNRARPSQVASDIINKKNGTLLNSETADTPSYPSGHAFQAYYLAKILSKKFPNKKEQLMELAKRIGDIRIIAGLHYPSDRDFAYWLVDNLLK
jgi:hypothetical protein